MPTPDARNLTTTTLIEASQRVSYAQQQPVPIETVYTYKDLKPAAKKVVNALRRRSSKECTGKSKEGTTRESTSESTQPNEATMNGLKAYLDNKDDTPPSEHLQGSAVDDTDDDTGESSSQDLTKETSVAKEEIRKNGLPDRHKSTTAQGKGRSHRDIKDLAAEENNNNVTEDSAGEDDDEHESYDDAVDSHSVKEFWQVPRTPTFTSAAQQTIPEGKILDDS